MASNDTRLLATPVHHSYNLVHAIDHGWHLAASAVASNTWQPLSNFFKTKVLDSLDRIERGELTIVTDDHSYTYGSASTVTAVDGRQLRAKLVVKNEAFWTRLVLFGDLGFAEAYMDGTIECEEISNLLRIFITNRKHLQDLTGSHYSLMLSLGRKLTAYKFSGDQSNSRANISAHYDLGNALFSSFLSEDMNYSSAIFKDYNGDLLPDPSHDLESHEEAQLRKMRKILNRLKIQPGDRVLEIGTGWGSLSILAASSFDCTIDTITLSSEQLALATQRVADAGLSHRITLHLMDFRAVRSKPEWQGAFDKFVSIEMMEHVGREFLEEYWRVADWAMKGDKATGVVQVITMPEARIPAYDSNGVDFIQKWIFPGCYIPSLETLISTMNNGTSGRLTVDAVSNIGPHYARTLREWKRRFLRNWEGTIKQLLIEQHSLDEQALGAFKRRWMYYFDYCEAGFSTRTLGDHIITFTREGNVDFGCDVDSLAIDSDWGENVKGTDQRRT